MDKKGMVANLIDAGVVAVVRYREKTNLRAVIEAIYQGGVTAIEVTTNTPGWTDVISEIRSQIPGILIGAGTVSDKEKAKTALAAGAQYLVSPNVNEEVINCANEYDVPVIMGAFSPTEIHKAYQLGADFIKLFPADHLGIRYMKSVLSTLSDAKLAPSGGITSENCLEWKKAGATLLCAGSAMVNASMIAQKDYQGLTALAQSFSAKMKA